MSAPAETSPVPGPAAEGPRNDAALLAEFLATRDAACPLCGYNLRGLTGARCPECGRRLRLSVGLSEPYLGAWVLLAAATCAAGGTGVFFTLMVAAAGWPRVFGSGVKTFFLNIALLYFMFSIPVAVAVLVARRRILRVPIDWQWSLAWFFVATTCGAMLVFAALVT